MGDYAVSPNLLQGHSPGARFSFTDAHGAVHYGTYNDTSMRAPGVPNQNVIEGWNQPDLGRIGAIKWLASGGIVTGPTRALLGEAGPEAVIPLNRSGIARAGIGGGGAFAPNISLSFNITGGGGEEFASQVAQIVQERFEEIQEAAFHHYQRIHLS
jgi:hypothetical protein